MQKLLLILVLLLTSCGPSVQNDAIYSTMGFPKNVIDAAGVKEISKITDDAPNISSYVNYGIGKVFSFYPGSYKLSSVWRPLRWIQESPGLSGTRFTTINDTVYVSDLNSVLAMQNTPEGNKELEGILFHERYHAIRQRNRSNWLIKYGTEPHFRWQEEKLGYEIQLRYWVEHDVDYSPENIASLLNESYGPIKMIGIKLTGEMVSYEDALEWINSLELD